MGEHRSASSTPASALLLHLKGAATKARFFFQKPRPLLCVSCHILLRKTTSSTYRHHAYCLCELTSKAGRVAGEEGMAATANRQRERL